MGRSSTHVANGYGRNTIYVRCDAERRRLKDFSGSGSLEGNYEGIGANASGSFSGSYEINIIKAGFTKIVPGDYVKFEVDCSKTSTVYISVYAKIGDRWELICESLPKNEDYSVIVTSSGQVVDTKHGAIWKRADGRPI